MITNKMKVVQLKMREARFWPKMKFEPIFFQVLWQFFNPKGSLLLAGGRGVGGNSACPTNFGRNLFEFFRTHTASKFLFSLYHYYLLLPRYIILLANYVTITPL
jgi:hypothetical protein